MSARMLEARLGQRFRHPRLLTRALTHKSFAHERGGSHNERFELLGDSVLQLAVTLLLMERFPDAGEGELSRMRSRLVNEATLAEIAAELGVGSALRLGVGEEASGGRERSSILANAVEAILGALYVDGGFEVCHRLVSAWTEPRIAELSEPSTAVAAGADPVSRLQELAQSLWRETPTYEVLGRSGPDHAPQFTAQVLVGDRVRGRGEGRTKRAAFKEAAKAALALLTEPGA